MATVTLNPIHDSRMSSYNATSNYGSDTELLIGYNTSLSNKNRGLFRFDLSDIPTNAIVSSATLRIFAVTDDSGNASTLSVYRLKQNWIEAQVTWKVYSTGNNWSAGGASNVNDCETSSIGSVSLTATETLNEYKDISLDTNAIEEMIDGTFTNYGFLLRTGESQKDRYWYTSRENAGSKPELVIVYTLPSEGGRTFQAVIIG